MLTPTVLVAVAAAATRPPVDIPPDHFTKAELTSFRSTPSFDETVAFLLRLTATSPYLRIDYFGSTGQGRRMPVVIASKERAFTPDAAWKSGKPIVLVLASIHAGEVDGTDASLILLRDLALGNRPEILDGVTLLVVPIYNIDGHERTSKFNRPNQNGPVDGMGFRSSARGLDLNRDWLKADAPETRALVSLAATWKPDLFVDNHVTDGADFQATLTLSYANEPYTPKPLADWLRKVVPRALRSVEELGYKTAPYVDFVDHLDPLKGIDAGPSSPRYSTGYFPLRGVASILVETHAIKPYGDRVKSNEAFLHALLAETASEAKALLAARETVRQEARRGAVGSLVPVDAETDRTRPETIDFRTFAWSTAISEVTGKPVVRYDRTKPMTVKVPVFEHTKTTRTVPRPAAFLVPSGWPGVEDRLKAHGVRYQKLETAQTLAVGTYRATAESFAKASYQGRTRVSAKIARRTETRLVPANSLYIPLDTELAGTIIHLLDPESPDSLFAWGEFNTVFEQKEYADVRVLDGLLAEKLKDAAFKAEWEEKLKESNFANDTRARMRFVYERTPYWDEMLGLVPVYRLDAPLTLPASGAEKPGS